jgi:hypothetical protein
MSESIPFRSAPAAEPAAPAVASAPAAPTTQPARTDTSDAPPSLYQEINKQPYAAKYLDIELYYHDDDFAEVQDQAKALDAYVLKQIKARGMKDDPGSYKEIISAMYKEIGKSPNEDPTHALKRLSTAASALERLQSAKLPPALSAASLTPDEFEGIQP